MPLASCVHSWGKHTSAVHIFFFQGLWGKRQESVIFSSASFPTSLIWTAFHVEIHLITERGSALLSRKSFFNCFFLLPGEFTRAATETKNVPLSWVIADFRAWMLAEGLSHSGVVKTQINTFCCVLKMFHAFWKDMCQIFFSALGVPAPPMQTAYLFSFMAVKEWTDHFLSWLRSKWTKKISAKAWEIKYAALTHSSLRCEGISTRAGKSWWEAEVKMTLVISS